MMTPFQMRIAMAALELTRTTLAAKVGVHMHTISNALEGKGVNSKTMKAIQDVFEDAGLVVLDAGDQRGEGVGIRFRDRAA